MAEPVIAAIATPAGRGGVGIVRLSGADLRAQIEGWLGAAQAELQPRRAHYRDFLAADGSVLDQGIMIWFPGPDSFTGEDVLELQGHGGPVVLDMLLERSLQLGARLAAPGEFSERAFLNDKLDLAQAEAIADLIDSSSRTAARSALHSLQGVFSARCDVLAESMLALRVWVEAALDFADEEIDFLADGQVMTRLQDMENQLQRLRNEADQGRCLAEGMTVALCGAPNAGKSSLLNALAGAETAIVTDIPGTTRDVLRERILVHGMPLHLVDTAGIRETEDAIEREGVRRARVQIELADRILLLVDATQMRTRQQLTSLLQDMQLPSERLTILLNKTDLLDGVPEIVLEHAPVLAISAHTGDGLEVLRNHLCECAGFKLAGEAPFIARRRHLDALQRAQTHLQEGRTELQQTGSGELLAEQLRMAHDALGEITGKVCPDQLLGAIFSSFCIGK